MKKVKYYILILWASICFLTQAQVSTNFNNEILISSQGRFAKDYLAQVDYELPTKNIKELLEQEKTEIAKSSETKPFHLAVPIPIDLNIAYLINWSYDKEYAYGKFTIKLNGALSVSINFDKFYLPKSTEMYVYNENGEMITGPITENENNPNKIWGSWVYRGQILIIEIKTPVSSKEQLLLHSNNIAYGYKEIYKSIKVGGFGQSGSCNINVLCPLGNGWEGERNSVALILNANGQTWCSGSIIMNACSSSRPFFLTANHCYATDPIQDVAAWRFTFQAWSPTCTTTQNSNGVTYNGSTLRANWANSDFCLVELNNTPPSNSGINYAGWTRSVTPAQNATGIHHPSGDVMKISRAENAVTVASYGGTINQHWRANWSPQNNGAGQIVTAITEGGSSGSPLFDQNHRIIGQLNGGPSVCDGSQLWDFYGRFDLSWTGNGTDATRLSNWLDPNNSNALTTNTTNISYLTRNITGPSTVCSLNATYAVTNLPSGQVVNWTFSPNLIYVSGQGTNQLVVKSSDGDPLPLVSLSYDNYGSSGWVRAGTCNNVVLEKTIWVGLPAYTPIVTGSSTMFCSQSLYVEKYNRNAAWSVYGPLQVIGVNYGYKCTVKGTESGVGWVYATNSNLCGSFRGEKLVQVTCSSYSVFPNPTNSEVTISLLPDNSIDKSFQKDKSIKSIRVVDKSGITLSTQKYGSETFETKIDLSKFTTGVYIIKINEGTDEESYTIVKQ